MILCVICHLTNITARARWIRVLRWISHRDWSRVFIRVYLCDDGDMLMTCITNLNRNPTGINFKADDFAPGLCGIIFDLICRSPHLRIIKKSFIIQNLCNKLFHHSTPLIWTADEWPFSRITASQVWCSVNNDLITCACE